ncbi:MAG TPA: two-component regulator propeller domain-containing protein [Lacunisphaera sp.]|nr:two-component regulator propeller domain-containing protein [Lacunisphaera sp.]
MPHPRFVLRLIATACLFPLAAAPGATPAETPPHAPGEYALREWHEQDGLPSDELTAVLQDRRGFLWIATSNGLARFDGVAFEPTEVPAGGIPRGLALAPDGAANAPGSLVLPGAGAAAEREAGSFVLRGGTFHFKPEPELAGRNPQTVFAGRDGTVWIGCEDGTVLRRRGAETQLFDPPATLEGKKPPAFAMDAQGQVWILRGNRLARVQGNQLVEISFPAPEPELRIASSATGGIWVFTRTTLLRWTGNALQEALRLPDLRGAHYVQAVLEDSHGYLWVGTRSQGLCRIIGQDLLRVPTSNENVTALCEDTDGNLWAATDGGGLSRLRAKAHRLIDEGSGLTDNFTYTVAEDTAGAVWLANRDGGMVRIANGKLDPISTRLGWRPFSAKSVYPSPDGKVWMTGGLGVFRADAAHPEAVTRVPELNQLRNVRSTFVARNGDYWLAAENDRVVRWRQGALTSFGPEEGFDAREVRSFAEDAAGRIWVGAAAGRLHRFTGERIERLSFPNADSSGSLQVIRFEPDGTMLLGTTRRGVFIFPGGDLARPRNLDTSRGLASNNITQILDDDHARTWFAARTGIFWVHASQLREFAAGGIENVHSILLGQDDDLPYLSCLGLFQPAAWKASDGILWFATRHGMLRTDPALVSSGNGTPPPVEINSLSLDGRNHALAPDLAIGPEVRRIQLRLSALNLSAPESVQIQYRLEGFDSDWLILERSRLVTYPRLPPGHYVFHARTSNGSGAWSGQPPLLALHVIPAWWQTPWAQMGGVAVLVALVGVGVRTWSHRRLRRRLERSESARLVEHERARIARNIHDDLGASLTRISLLTQAAQQENTAHSPTLDKIYEATRAITRSMDEIVWAVNPQQDNIESLVYYLGNFAPNFLGAANIRCRLESPSTLPDTPLTSQIRHHLYLCCKETLHNVVKHAAATEVVIRISAGQGVLAIAIADNGRGLTATNGATPDALRADPGHGLANLRQRMAEIRGTCEFAASPGGGTTVTFTVPLAATFPP